MDVALAAGELRPLLQLPVTGGSFAQHYEVPGLHAGVAVELGDSAALSQLVPAGEHFGLEAEQHATTAFQDTMVQEAWSSRYAQASVVEVATDTWQEDCTVTFTIQAEAPPLREDAAGAMRVGNSSVLLELVIWAFQDGATPETIVQRYSTLALPDVYAVIAYYLRHRSEIEAYLARREQEAEEVRKRIEKVQGDLSEIRARLLAHRQAQR